MSKKPAATRARSAITGRFVKKCEAERNPKTTIVERVKTMVRRFRN